MRLLIEFFLIRPADARMDFSARDFGWEGSQAMDCRRLRELWQVASSYLVHFGRGRTPEELQELQPEDTSLRGLLDATAQLLDVVEVFVLHIEASACPEATQFRQALNSARAALLTSG